MKRQITSGVIAAALLAAALFGTPSQAAPSRAELEVAQERLLEIERDFELVVERYNLVHEQLVAVQAEMGEIRLVAREIERRMSSKEDAAISLASELYKGGTTDAMEVVLSAENLAEVMTRLQYLKSTQKAQTEVFEALAADRSLLDQKLAELDEARNKALQAETELNELREDIELKLVEQEDEVATLRAAVERAEELARQRELAAQRAAREAAAATGTLQSVGPPIPQTVDYTAKAANPRAQAAVDAALSQVGKPYQWGAEGPDSYDCSGLTLWAWAHAGVSLPHNSGMQYDATPRVERSDWQPGDLLFFGSPIHHVSMYIGNGQMVEAPYSGQYVRVVSASRSDYVGAGRPGV